VTLDCSEVNVVNTGGEMKVLKAKTVFVPTLPDKIILIFVSVAQHLKISLGKKNTKSSRVWGGGDQT